MLLFNMLMCFMLILFRYANCAQWLLAGGDNDRLLQYADWLVFIILVIPFFFFFVPLLSPNMI